MSAIIADLEAGAKKCPLGSRKSRSKKAGKKGHCVKTKYSYTSRRIRGGASPVVAEIEAGAKRTRRSRKSKQCPSGFRKSQSKKASKKGRCVRRSVRYSSRTRSAMRTQRYVTGGEAPVVEAPAAAPAFPDLQLPLLFTEAPVAGGKVEEIAGGKKRRSHKHKRSHRHKRSHKRSHSRRA